MQGLISRTSSAACIRPAAGFVHCRAETLWLPHGRLKQRLRLQVKVEPCSWAVYWVDWHVACVPWVCVSAAPRLSGGNAQPIVQRCHVKDLYTCQGRGHAALPAATVGVSACSKRARCMNRGAPASACRPLGQIWSAPAGLPSGGWAIRLTVCKRCSTSCPCPRTTPPGARQAHAGPGPPARPPQTGGSSA